MRTNLITAPNLDFPWLVHGFGLRTSTYPEGLTTVQQVHSARVLDACGRRAERLGEGDAIISAEPGVAIGIKTADCVPVLLADTENRVVKRASMPDGAGTAANISCGATIDAMRSRGCRPEDISCGDWPVDWVRAATRSARTWHAISPLAMARRGHRKRQRHGGSKAPDLRAINETQARECWRSGKVWKSNECTFCRAERFYSFRREKEQAGRMISFSLNRLA